MTFPGRSPNHFPQTALQAYGDHHADCLIYSRLVTPVCSCGFQEALAVERAGDPLDVERLARAIKATGLDVVANLGQINEGIYSPEDAAEDFDAAYSSQSPVASEEWLDNNAADQWVGPKDPSQIQWGESVGPVASEETP